MWGWKCLETVSRIESLALVDCWSLLRYPFVLFFLKICFYHWDPMDSYFRFLPWSVTSLFSWGDNAANPLKTPDALGLIPLPTPRRTGLHCLTMAASVWRRCELIGEYRLPSLSLITILVESPLYFTIMSWCILFIGIYPIDTGAYSYCDKHPNLNLYLGFKHTNGYVCGGWLRIYGSGAWLRALYKRETPAVQPKI